MGSSISPTRIVVAPAGYGTIIGEGFCDESMLVHGFLPGGELSPSLLRGQPIYALHTLGPYSQLLIAIGGALPKSFFAAVTAPGVNDGQPLFAASATHFISPDAIGATVWRWATSGILADGDVIFE